jgi:hypothetical protein
MQEKQNHPVHFAADEGGFTFYTKMVYVTTLSYSLEHLEQTVRLPMRVTRLLNQL